MDFQDLLTHYFDAPELDGVNPVALETGIEQMRVDFGLEKDRGRRFGLWTLLYMLGAAPELDVAFKEEADREAARDFMDMVDRTSAD